MVVIEVTAVVVVEATAGGQEGPELADIVFPGDGGGGGSG